MMRAMHWRHCKTRFYHSSNGRRSLRQCQRRGKVPGRCKCPLLQVHKYALLFWRELLGILKDVKAALTAPEADLAALLEEQLRRQKTRIDTGCHPLWGKGQQDDVRPVSGAGRTVCAVNLTNKVPFLLFFPGPPQIRLHFPGPYSRRSQAFHLRGEYHHLIVSPFSLKRKVLRHMDEEIQKGADGRIIMKMNSVTDMDFIRKVQEASAAGVKVDLIVRGICCILPGVKENTENLRVTSIVGRYLEHPRVFVFGTGETAKVYIGSADMMTRNTEKRVEVACPIYDDAIKRRLIHDLKVMLADNTLLLIRLGCWQTAH